MWDVLDVIYQRNTIILWKKNWKVECYEKKIWKFNNYVEKVETLMTAIWAFQNMLDGILELNWKLSKPAV